MFNFWKAAKTKNVGNKNIFKTVFVNENIWLVL